MCKNYLFLWFLVNQFYTSLSPCIPDQQSQYWFTFSKAMSSCPRCVIQCLTYSRCPYRRVHVFRTRWGAAGRLFRAELLSGNKQGEYRRWNYSRGGYGGTSLSDSDCGTSYARRLILITFPSRTVAVGRTSPDNLISNCLIVKMSPRRRHLFSFSW